MTLNTSGPRQAPHDLLGPDANAAVAAPEGRVDIVRMAAWLVVGTVIIGLLYYGQEVLIPLAIAFLISFALGPLVKVLVRRGIPQVAAVSVVMLTVIAMLLGLGLLITSQVSVLSAELPAYQSTIRAKIQGLGQQMEGPGLFDGVPGEFRSLVRGDCLEFHVYASRSRMRSGPSARATAGTAPDK